MQYEQRISRDQGNYIVASGREFESILHKDPIELSTGKIMPGEKTDLHGWFSRKSEYCGILDNDSSIKKAYSSSDGRYYKRDCCKRLQWR